MASGYWLCRMLHVDNWVRSLFQAFYNVLLDSFDVRIGSFRTAIALAPLAGDWAIRIARGEPPATLLWSIIFVTVLMRAFYSRQAMQSDNRLQAMGRLSALNAASEAFQRRTFHIRMAYLILFTTTTVIFHHFDGFALLDIVFARCIKVRPRIHRERYASTLLQATPA